MHVGSAPGRVNLIGEHLDYNGGLCLPIALTCRTKATVSARSDGTVRITSRQQSEPVELQVADLDRPLRAWTDYVTGVIWALDVAGTGWDVALDSGVPVGAGLSSSAALECALAVALADATDSDWTRDEIVAACVRAENEYVGASTGSLDQSIAMFAEEGHALLLDFASGQSRQVRWEPPGELVVIDTHAAHELAGGEYADRRRSCDTAAEQLGVTHLAAEAGQAALATLTDPELHRRARHVVTEQDRVRRAVAAVESGSWDEVGELMTASHVSLRDDYEVSCRELDVAVDAALEAGALGARMTGGGFGGSAIALVPPGGAEDVRAAVVAAYSREHLRPPTFVDGTAGSGAEVSRRPG